VEQRARWLRKLDASKGVYEMSCRNVFLIEEKLPLHAVAMYYHSLFVGNQLPANAPRIYAPLFLFEASAYLAEVLLRQQEPPLQYCGLRLVEHLLGILVEPVPATSLQLDVHKRFCEALCKIVGYSPQVALRQLGLHVLRQYILGFDDQGKYLILKNLLETLQHDGLMGYLGGMYKDLVDKALSKSGPIPEVYSGKMFREMLLLCVCVLPHDVKSDLLLHSDRLCHALNILRYFAVRDKADVTGFWQALPDITRILLDPLGKALNFSMAHYKAYKERVERGQPGGTTCPLAAQTGCLEGRLRDELPECVPHRGEAAAACCGHVLSFAFRGKPTARQRAQDICTSVPLRNECLSGRSAAQAAGATTAVLRPPIGGASFGHPG